jgi:glycosyltransferase involved in cell wall biosynthesis
MDIDVVLPCLNEAGALPWVLSRMPNGYRPIVADNGSTDGSAAVAAAYGSAASAPPATPGCSRPAATSSA